MKDWNHDGKINAKDDAVFHILIKASEKKRQYESTSAEKHKINTPAIIAVLYLAAWISGSIPINGFTGFLALICVIVLGYVVFN